MKPTLTESAVDAWITPSQACKILGIKGAGIYRLLDPACPFLIFKRPLPKKILVNLRSVMLLGEATQDPEFWESTHLQRAFRQKLNQITQSETVN